MITKNAQITDTMLGFEGHGVLTCFIYLGYGSSSAQGFGGWSLGKEYTDKWIRGILKTVGVESWEKLKGQHVRVELDSEFGKIQRIGHLLEDNWFDPKE